MHVGSEAESANQFRRCHNRHTKRLLQSQQVPILRDEACRLHRRCRRHKQIVVWITAG
jgi:hypothetical protein